MLELIIGAKGNGKTRKMVEKANNESKRTNGSIIYIDKSNKHMYELSNIIRLINLHEYDIKSPDAFMGFIQGLISANHNLTHIFLDNFMMMCNIGPEALEAALNEIDTISEKYNVTFFISTAVEESMLPASYAGNVICKL